MTTAWFFTIVLALIVIAIVRAEVVCGRRSKNFIDNVMPEIDRLKHQAVSKYKAKYGRTPTAPFETITPPRGFFARKKR